MWKKSTEYLGQRQDKIFFFFFFCSGMCFSRGGEKEPDSAVVRANVLRDMFCLFWKFCPQKIVAGWACTCVIKTTICAFFFFWLPKSTFPTTFCMFKRKPGGKSTQSTFHVYVRAKKKWEVIFFACRMFDFSFQKQKKNPLWTLGSNFHSGGRGSKPTVPGKLIFFYTRPTSKIFFCTGIRQQQQ